MNNPPSSTGDTTSTTTTTTESSNVTTAEQTNDQRRGDILPIVYDVQSIPTIGGSGTPPMIRGGPARTRPYISSKLIKETEHEGELFDLNYF